jgi:hypothetical protein
MRVSPRLSMSAGLRYEVQTHLRDYNNIDPRIGFAYRVRPSTVFRWGFGIFHQRYNIDRYATLIGQDGIRTSTYTSISNPTVVTPSMPISFVGVEQLGLKASDLAAPYLLNGSASIEKWFDSGAILSLSADWVRGLRQLRTRDINAPVPAASTTTGELSRPFYPIATPILQTESVGSLHAKNVSLRLRTPRLPIRNVGLWMDGGYSLGWSDDDNSFPADSYDLRAEWGPSNNYPRHHLWTGTTLRTPWGLSLAALIHAHSGFPYTTFTSDDKNGDGNYTDRPAGVGRNSHDGSNYFNVDLNLSKSFVISRLGDGVPALSATLFVYGQNVLNSRNYTNVYSREGFPEISTGASLRRIEAGIKIRF